MASGATSLCCTLRVQGENNCTETRVEVGEKECGCDMDTCTGERHLTVTMNGQMYR